MRRQWRRPSLADAALDPHEHDARNGGGRTAGSREQTFDASAIMRSGVTWLRVAGRIHPVNAHADEVIE
jgi:hypothetical protein